jgi:putative peptidoglycan lipid II flippase
VVLNVCWLAAVWLVAPFFAPDKHAQAYVIAVAVVIAGVLQVGVQLPVLFRAGFRYDYDWRSARDALGRIGTSMAPMLVGLAVTQINTFLDSLIAWGLAAEAAGQTIGWLGHTVEYPMQRGAAAALFYGERLYYFPLGVLGLAVAAAIFPLLSRHVARGDNHKLGADLTLGLRLVICLGVPAGVGLIMLATPLATLLFEHGQFTAADTARTARVITGYSTGVWAFCALPVMIRGFYALGDCGTPAKVAGWIVGLNLTLNLVLIWTPLAEAGLAVATSVSAAVQLVVLMVIFSRRKSHLNWPAISATTARTLFCTLLMTVVGYATLWQLPAGESIFEQILRVALPVASSVAVYCGTYWLSGGRELAIILGRVDVD